MNQQKEGIISVFGSSEIGQQHINKGLPCQDSWSAAVFDCGDLGTAAVIAVSDGLGSAAHSDLGSRLAVNSAVDSVGKYFTKCYSDGLFIADLVRDEVILKEAVESAINTLTDYSFSAIAKGDSIFDDCSGDTTRAYKSLSCTLAIVLIYRGRVSAVQIGDGAVVVEYNTGNIGILVEPVESEYINEVTPITSEKCYERMNSVYGAENIDSLAVFTDGCIRSVIVKRDGKMMAYDPFFKPLFKYFQNIGAEMDNSSISDPSNDISDLLKSAKICDTSDDDKTLVIASIAKLDAKSDTKLYAKSYVKSDQ